jgi:hypothetical protein
MVIRPHNMVENRKISDQVPTYKNASFEISLDIGAPMHIIIL